MTIAKKITALALSSFFLLGSVACNTNTDKDKGGSSKGMEVTIAGETVPEDLYGYIFRTSRDYMNQNGMTAWENPDGSVHEENMKSLKQRTEDQLRLMFAVRDLAKKENLSFTDEEEKLLKEQWDKIVTQNGGVEVLEKDLAKQGLTVDSYIEYFWRDNFLKDKLTASWFGDQLLKAQHILIAFPEALPEDADDEAKKKFEQDNAEVKKRAEDLLQRAKSGESFEELVDKYGEDPGMKTSPEGYIFAEGVMVTEFYEGTKALKENEISDLVETTYGYHIIKRLPLDVDELVQSVVKKGTLSDMLGTEIPTQVDEKLKEHGATLEVSYGAGFDTVKATSFDFLVAPEEEEASSSAPGSTVIPEPESSDTPAAADTPAESTVTSAAS